MKPYLLDVLYLGGACAALPYLTLAGRGRRIFEHLPRRCRELPARAGRAPCVWVHGVSVGEILSARRFLECFTQAYPGWDVVLSTTTTAGIDASRKHYPAYETVSYPFDLSYFVRRSFQRVRPDLVLIVEHELWPNFLWHAQARSVPVALVNGRLSERSRKGYRWLSRLTRWPPPGIVRYCVEDEGSAEGFRRLGVPSDIITVTGNFKFDNVPRESIPVRQMLGWTSAAWVIVGASTHAGEESMLLDSYLRLHDGNGSSRLILAPRHVERVQEVQRLVEQAGLRAVRWSALARRPGQDGAGSPPGAHGDTEVLLVDTMGDLDLMLTSGDAVFVGGSLVPFGGHNVVAPSGAGLPVVIGPHHQNFRSVVRAFLEQDALVTVANPVALAEALARLYADRPLARAIAERARDTVARHAGASERTLEALRPLIDAADRRARVPLPS